MTNINCSFNCIYQKDGKCNLDNVTVAASVTSTNSCAYFKERDHKEEDD